MIDETLFDAEEKMEKAVSVSRDDLSSIRTGRANPSMFNRIVIDYYGSATPITQLASINVPEARLVVIKPYEAGQLGNIEAAIRKSDLGVNPTNDGTLIRVAVPQLTEERRRELVKQAKAKGEDAKVSVRNIRRKAKDDLDSLKEVGEDEIARAEKDLDASTKQHVDAIDDARSVRIDKRKVRLEEPIREIGTHMVEIELADGTTASVKTIVTEEK